MDSLLLWDQSTFLAINHGLGTPGLDDAMLNLTYLAEGLPLTLILLCCALLVDRAGRRARVIFVAAGVLSGALLVQGLKSAVGRPRPIPTLAARGTPVREVGRPPRGNTSWPSGHTQAAFAAAVVVGEILRRARWWLLALAALVGLSRIYVGAHFPLDVVSGAAIGLFT